MSTKRDNNRKTEIKTENPEKKKPKTITTVRDFTKGAKAGVKSSLMKKLMNWLIKSMR